MRRCFSCLFRPAAGLLAGAGLGLLPGAAPRLAAQALVPDPYYEAPDDGVTPAQHASYAARKVHTVLVKGQLVATERPGHPTLSWPTEYRVYDRQGRLTSTYRKGYGKDVLSERTDLAYTPTGELETSLSWRRVADPADTSLLGRNWVPTSSLWYPPAGGGPGRYARRADDTGDWEVQYTYRRWSSHDTTYVATYDTRRRLDWLSRTYYAAADPTLWRDDQVRYGGVHGAVEATYTYTRRNARRQVLEVGRLAFGNVPEREPAEDLARRTNGRPVPRYTYAYDARGRLKQRSTAPNAYEVLAYDADGRCTQLQWLHRTEPLRQTTSYTYLPNGLLQQSRLTDPQQEVRNWLVYEYTYYP